MDEFLEVWRGGRAELMPLEGDCVTLGRDEGNLVTFPEDLQISRLHAVMQRYGPEWCVRDVGSRNGTFVNGEQVSGERKLRHGDEISIGDARLLFRSDSRNSAVLSTVGAQGPPELTRRERDVLVALCRPLASGAAFREPASIRELARELVVSEAAVKFHLANLYDKFGIHDTGRSRRLELANEAVRRRAVSLTELRPNSD